MEEQAGVEINKQKQVKRYKEIELDLRMRLTAKVLRSADLPMGRDPKMEPACDGEGLDEYLSSAHDSLTY